MLYYIDSRRKAQFMKIAPMIRATQGAAQAGEGYSVPPGAYQQHYDKK